MSPETAHYSIAMARSALAKANKLGVKYMGQPLSEFSRDELEILLAKYVVQWQFNLDDFGCIDRLLDETTEDGK